MKVAVYFNLRRRLFSVKALEGPRKGRVIAHSEIVTLTGVTFKVSEAGRQRVLRERQKNVHAFVIGELDLDRGLTTSPGADVHAPWTRCSYNPYEGPDFVTAWGNPIETAAVARCHLSGGKARIIASI
jgi:hypothetical protein